jgi:pyruvate dehydrogenase E2 component (dihydrolipoamide acetyltransferase)
MPVEIVLPRVDMGQESGIIGAWKVANGERVTEGQILFEINTDKAVMEVDSPAAGEVHGISAAVGETVAVGTAVAWIYKDGETPPKAGAPAPKAAAVAAPAAAAQAPKAAQAAPAPVVATSDKPRATPIARRLAKTAGLDLSRIAGSGPRGRIMRADIEKAAAAPQPAPAAAAAGSGKLVPFDTIRRIVAKRLTESVRTAPHFYLTAHLDMTALNDLRARVSPRIEKRTGTRVSVTMLLLRCIGPLLVRHPLLNASAEGEAVRYHDSVDIGVAMERDGSLVVPVLRGVHLKSLEEIAAEFARLTASVRDRTVSPADLTGSTFTISNLGMYGVDAFTAIINPPEAAILAVGRSVDTPVGHNGKVELRPQATFCLSSDHRIVDGVVAAKFMASLREAIETPETLL